jgi:hypothetical protein
VVHVLLVAGIVAFAYRTFRRASGALVPAVLATHVLVALSWYRLFQLRPDLVSLLAILGLHALVLEGDGAPPWRRVAAALALLLVWVNAHSLFAIGLALVFAALVGVGVQAALRRWLVAGDAPRSRDAALARRLASVLVLGVLVTLLNPRGIEQHATFFIESSSGDIWHLEDDFLHWNPFAPADASPALTFYSWLISDLLLAAFVATAALAGLRVLRRRTPAALAALDAVPLALGAASLVAMFVAVRFHWLSIFPLLYLLRAGRRRAASAPAEGRAASWSLAGASLAIALAFPSGVHLDAYARELSAEPDGYWRSPYLDERYAGPGVRFLEEAGLEGRLFNPFNLGGFLAYRLAPDLRTFIDGRMDHYPSEVLADYLTLRRASRTAGFARMREILDRWEIDVFFGTNFPEDRYANRRWVAYLRHLPEWVPVFVSQHHSIYLRRSKSNARNFARVKAYYLQRRLPFSVSEGLDVARILQRRPGWIERQRLLPGNFGQLQAARASEDVGTRLWALRSLGDLFWRIGDFRDQVEVDRELLALRPREKEPRRRLADALLHLDRLEEALEVAEALLAEDPGYEDIALIHRIAKARVAMAARSE